MTKITPVLMVGGAGTRLWPMSRKETPKQFQSLITEQTLFQETLLRVTGRFHDIDFAPPIIIGSTRYLELIDTQLQAINVTPGQIILEPSAQNTAAVAAIAAHAVKAHDGGLTFLLPSDSYMQDVSAFRHAIADAAQTAKQGWITVLGIAPNRPETGYGYIKAGDELSSTCHQVARFIEKPCRNDAEAYLADGGYTWNAGHFLFAPDVMLAELQAYAPDILAPALEAYEYGRLNGKSRVLDADTFAQCDPLSIDYAVMEKTSKAAVYGPVACGWDDVGSWSAIRDLSETTEIGDIVSIDTKNCYLRTDEGTLIAAIGVSDLIVVAHDGAVLIMPADQAQNVKKVVAALKDRFADHHL